MSTPFDTQLIDWRCELHTWPELSGKEEATNARLTAGGGDPAA